MYCKILSVSLSYLLMVFLVPSKTFALENDNDSSVILDLLTDTTSNTSWKLSSTTFPKWFEYFENTTQLTKNQSGSCSEIISKTLSHLDDTNGIWVACDDSTISPDCESLGSHSCYPEINFLPESFDSTTFNSVKIRIALLGQATLRFNVENHFCIDYSYRKDPMSRCEYFEILPELEWVDVEIMTDESINFREFSIQFFPRFKGDAVLIDKIEVIEDPPCYDPFTDCTTTGSTESTTAISSSTQSNEALLSILNVESDAGLPVDYQWNLPARLPKWMEYYEDYVTFLDNKTDLSKCASLIISKFTNRDLPDVLGIWSSCRVYPTCSVNPSSCHPTINYKSAEEHYIQSIKSKFHLQGSGAIVRLHVGGKCWDYKYENLTLSPCAFVPVSQMTNKWNAFFWTGQKAMEFRLELVSLSDTDVVLLDMIEVQYKKCENINDCLYEPTNPPEITSTLRTTTTDWETTTDCESPTTTTEESELTEGTTATSTTTKQSEMTYDTTIITPETSELTDATNSIETTTTTDSDGTICTTRVTRTTTPRSGSSAVGVINMLTFVIVFFVILVK